MLKDSLLDGSFSVSGSNLTGAIVSSGKSNLSPSSFAPDIAVLPLQSPRLFSNSSISALAELPSPRNLILDFNGVDLRPGKTATGQDYALPIDIPIIDGEQTVQPLSRFKGFSSSNSSVDDNVRNEQILQVLAGVREDFARFNVPVIWDDRGVSSPFFDNNSTVVIITDASPRSAQLEEGVAGRAPGPIEDNLTRPNVAIAFTEPLLGDSGNIATNSQYRLNNLINTISHEVGHTFGLQHPVTPPVREIMASRLGDASQDRQFLNVQLERDNGSRYSDEERLNENLGGALTLPPDDRVSNQILPDDTDRVPLFDRIPISGFRSVSDFSSPENARIDFVGDRDAFRFQVSTSGQYTIRVSSSEVTPVFTLWDENGDFITDSNNGKLTFPFIQKINYFVVVGTPTDQATTFDETDPNAGATTKQSGNLPKGQTGSYILKIGNSAPIANAAQYSVVEDSFISDNLSSNYFDPDGKLLSAVLVGQPVNGTLTFDQNGSFTYTPTPDFFGTDLFAYRVTDGLAFSEIATVSLNISEAPLIDLIGTPGRDILIGTDKRDRIIGLQSGDILTGGKGRNQFLYQNINEGGDRITDFKPGKDRIVLSGVLQSIGYKGSSPIDDGIFSFNQASNKLSVIQIDPDGSKLLGFQAVPFILLDNVSVTDLSNSSNFIFV